MLDWRHAGLLAIVALGCNTATADPGPGTDRSAATTQVAAAECASPKSEWIWCDDFERDRLSSYFEHLSANQSFVRDAGVGREGSAGMRARFETGQTNAGALHLAFGKTPQAYMKPVDAGTARYRTVYWRFYLRLEPGWIGGGGDKLTRATVFASGTSWAQAMVAHGWSGAGQFQDYLLLDPARGTDEAGVLRTTTYNDFANLSWLGIARAHDALWAPARTGRWECLEFMVKLNDPSQANGEFRLWHNGAPQAARSSLNWLGSFSAYGINAIFLENYWNAGSPRAQERYFDNFVVSTQPIGCSA